MKKNIKSLIFAFFILCVFIFFINHFVRVSDASGGSIGIIEEVLLKKSVLEFVDSLWSENYKRWSEASKGSEEVSNLIRKYGKQIIDDPQYEDIRIKSIEITEKSYQNASSIDKDYLKKSNSELPLFYTTYFINGLRLWNEGFIEKNNDKILSGIDSYNEFLLWMQSKDRDDFKSMR